MALRMRGRGGSTRLSAKRMQGTVVEEDVVSAESCKHRAVARRRVGLYIAGSLGAMLLIHLLGRFGYYMGFYSFVVADTFTVVALLWLGLSAALILNRAYNVQVITKTLVAASLFLALGQAVNVIDGIPAFGGMPIPVTRSLLFLKEPISAIGVVLFVGSIYWCVYELHLAKEETDSEKKKLATRMEERKEALDELSLIREQLEERVAERTAELARTNEELRCEIEERKQAEKTIAEQQARMVAAARMSELGIMAGSIAHEINNPLATISAGAQQLKTLLAMQDPSPEQVNRIGDAIVRNVDRVHGIIRALRHLTREGSGDGFSRTPVQSIISDTLELCQQRFHERGIALTVSGTETDKEIECRASQMSQVLMNLLNNAYDAVEKLDEKWIDLRVEDLGDDLLFTVTDSGRGLPPEVRQKMFIPFYTSKKEGRGLGLGLSISNQIVESHGGELHLDPECANTRFLVRIPKRKASRPA